MHNYLSYRYPVKEISQRKNSDTTCDRELVLKQFDAKVFSGTSKGIRFRRQNQRRLKNECTNRWVINVTLHFPFSFGCCWQFKVSRKKKRHWQACVHKRFYGTPPPQPIILKAMNIVYVFYLAPHVPSVWVFEAPVSGGGGLKYLKLSTMLTEAMNERASEITTTKSTIYI